MLEILGTVSAPGRVGRPNEDRCGAKGRFAWVIDGATGLGDDELIDGPSDAAWLAGQMDAAFREFADTAAGPAALLATAALICAEKFVAQRRRAPAERYELPTAAVLLAEFGAEGIALAELGDCAVYVEADGALTRFGGTERGRALEQQNAQNMMVAGGGRSPQVVSFLRKVRNMANMPGGYPIFAPEVGAADGARLHHLPVLAGDALLISDGYEAAIEDYALYDGKGLLAAARTDVRTPLDALREVEAADPDCRRFPRFKPSDDASALLVHFGPVQ